MSDVQVHEGWWLASDGKWYPPERHPDFRPPGNSPVAPTPPDAWTPANEPPRGATGWQPEVTHSDLRSATRRHWWGVAAVAAVVVVVAIGAYLLTHKSSTTSTTTPSAVQSSEATAYQLAQSINLRLSDLPSGWAISTGPDVATQSVDAAKSAVVSANQILAACVGQPPNTVAALLGNSAPGQVAIATSEEYESAAVPGEQMSSVTRTMGTAAEAQALAGPFASPNFTTCFATYETTLASAAVPGTTAQVEAVSLAAPAGVTTHAYLSTFTVPGKAPEVVGQTFIIGGTTQTRLSATNRGSPIPSATFDPAYTAVSGRVAKAAAG